MRTIKYFAIIILSVIFYSCNHLGKSASADFSNVIQIKYDTVQTQKVQPEEIVRNSFFVKLETNPNCLIGRVDKIIITDFAIVVIDTSIAKSIFIFDKNGRFKNKVSRVGNASNEYLVLVDAFINSKSELCLVDNYKDKFLTFTLDGKYLYSEDNKYPNFETNYINDDIKALFTAHNWALDGNKRVEKSCFVVVDKDYNPIYTFGESPHIKHPSFCMTRLRNLFRYGNRVYCTVNFGNVIYELTPDSVAARYELSVTPENLYEPVDDDLESSMTMIEARGESPYFTGDFFEGNNFSCFNLIFPFTEQINRWVFYNHNTGSVLSLLDRSSDPILDLLNTPIAMCGENILVEPVSATTICMMKERYESRGIHNERMDELSEGVSVDSNPVLLFYEIDLGEL